MIEYIVTSPWFWLGIPLTSLGISLIIIYRLGKYNKREYDRIHNK